jgi:hypothetical protein
MKEEDEKTEGLEECARKMKDDQKIERDSNVDVLVERLPIDDF